MDMFNIIPCVDIQQGRAVRLYEGDPERETVYFERPLDAALHWQGLGAAMLHLVDLDAALAKGDNKALIHQMAGVLSARLELGGGIRSYQDATLALQSVDRVVIGTAAIQQPELIDALVHDFGAQKVVVSIDARDGLVALKGWQEMSQLAASDLAKRCQEQGIETLIYTDISRDGTLKGVDPEPVKAMRQAFKHELIAGGGVARDEDFDTYEGLGLEGAIVGRALYEGTVSYPRAS